MAYSLTYSYDSASQSYSVTGWSGITTTDKVVIPSTYDDGTNGSHPVTSIGDNAFDSCHSLTSITLPNSMTSIGSGAFGWCESLTSITIPDSVTSIAGYAFAGCSGLTSIEIPSGVTNIGGYTFWQCSNLMNIMIPDSVTSIGTNAFAACDNLIQLILLPSAPPTLGSDAIPTTISKIYVQKSSKEAYDAATNWTAFANKIVSDDLYLSFARFNIKNKEYIKNSIKAYVDSSIEVAITEVLSTEV